MCRRSGSRCTSTDVRTLIRSERVENRVCIGEEQVRLELRKRVAIGIAPQHRRAADADALGGFDIARLVADREHFLGREATAPEHAAEFARLAPQPRSAFPKA